MSGVGVMYRFSDPNTGSNPGGGRKLNKKMPLIFKFKHKIGCVLSFLHFCAMFRFIENFSEYGAEHKFCHGVLRLTGKSLLCLKVVILKPLLKGAGETGSMYVLS